MYLFGKEFAPLGHFYSGKGINVSAMLNNFGVDLTGDKEKAAYYAEELRKKGARNVLVSIAEYGAVLASEDGKVYSCDAPKGTAAGSASAFSALLAEKSDADRLYKEIIVK